MYISKDNAGRVLSHRQMSVSWSTGQLEHTYKRDHAYNSFGKIDSTYTYWYENGQYDLTDIEWIEYNAAQEVTAHYYVGIENGQQSYEQRYEHYYNGAGILDHIQDYFYSNNTTSSLARYYAYEHDTNGMITLEREYDIAGPDTANDWYIGHEFHFGYDGPQLTQSRLDWYNSSGMTTWYDHRYVYSSAIFPIAVVESDDASEVMRLFPNPASDQLTILSEGDLRVVVVYDLEGKQVLAMTTTPAQQSVLPVSSLAPGRYIVAIQDEEGTVQRSTFVKQ